ncbi:hypothetical protein E5676_scaffold169G001880 [Cucumis melo var. makuwa]|uniref:Uncharacterized protein n=1 Tax=Cucumis melo var. makuwa TaxID=1194695 RepID=A0A5A7T7D4_CUCMM|nr:hypothetical protein E6C27_scaffold64G001870 [Cucumis melo var. makuwa]TYK00572.1 hypothetical protein E5676_scaffold169G001880 [Cucumis melo var. makuwa]
MANLQLGIAIAQATNALMHAVAAVSSVNNNQLASAFESSVEADASAALATEASNNVIAAVPNTADASLAMAAASLAAAASHIATAAVNGANAAQVDDLNQAGDQNVAQGVDLHQAGDQNVAQAVNDNLEQMHQNLNVDGAHRCSCSKSTCVNKRCGCVRSNKRCTNDCSGNSDIDQYPCRNR